MSEFTTAELSILRFIDSKEREKIASEIGLSVPCVQATDNLDYLVYYAVMLDSKTEAISKIKAYCSGLFTYIAEHSNNDELKNISDCLTLDGNKISYYVRHYTAGYRNMLYKTKSNILKSIEQNAEYKRFIQMDMSRFDVNTSKYCTKNFYKEDNIDKLFLSIDLRSANFQALRYVNPEIVNNKDTYVEFISEFTSDEYFKQSKKMRSAMLGELNAKRITKVESYLTYQIIGLFEFKDEDIVYFNKDEVIVGIDEQTAQKLSTKLRTMEQIVKAKLDLDVKVELFKLHSFRCKGMYMKEQIGANRLYDLVCIPKMYYPQVFKFVESLNVSPEDLVFEHDGELAKFIAPLNLSGETKHEQV